MTSQEISSFENYHIEQILGRGAFGIVSKIKVKGTNQIFALKQMDLSQYNDENCKELLREATKEFDILQKGLKHVVPSFGSHYNKNEEVFYFSMEYFPQNLKQLTNERLVEGKGNMSFEEYLPLLQDITEGLKSLLKENIIHQDIKPENILVKAGKNGKEAFIGDLGAARKFENSALLKESQSITIAGTPKWMAPEMKNLDLTMGDVPERKNIAKVDIFSLGLLSLYCLDAEGFSNYKKLNENSCYLHDTYLTQFKTKIPNEFYYLLKCMLSFDWNARPTVEELDQALADMLEKKKLSDRIKELEKNLADCIEELKKKDQIIQMKERELEEQRHSFRSLSELRELWLKQTKDSIPKTELPVKAESLSFGKRASFELNLQSL